MNILSSLLQPHNLTDTLILKNRIVMAPLTRSKATDDLVPTSEMADYYARRSDAGLIITEAILVSADGQGFPNSPGIFNQTQITAWEKVTKQVHQKGGKIFAQLWHTGRLSHSIYHNGKLPIAPSAIGWRGRVPQTDGLIYETPNPMTHADINRIVAQFTSAAKNAMSAGFDGIEIHGANGYLIDQFLHYSSNQRTDKYGGNSENMSRFLFEILDAIKVEVPENRIGLRLLPHAGEGETWRVVDHDDRDKDVFEYLLQSLNQRKLAYVHKGMYDNKVIPQLGCSTTEFIRKHYLGTVITCGDYTVNTASSAISQSHADLVAFGRPFIANHDLVRRIKERLPLKEYDVSQLSTLN